MNVVVCSKNPIKVQAVKEAFERYYTKTNYITLNMNKFSEVLKQPLTVDETISSAYKRIEIARKKMSADFFVALEGGIGRDKHGSYLTGYVVMQNKNGQTSLSGGYRMPLPQKIYNELATGKSQELGKIIDELSGIENSKQKGGAIALFTNDEIERKDLFLPAVIMALIPFKSKLYQKIEG